MAGLMPGHPTAPAVPPHPRPGPFCAPMCLTPLQTTQVLGRPLGDDHTRILKSTVVTVGQGTAPPCLFIPQVGPVANMEINYHAPSGSPEQPY